DRSSSSRSGRRSRSCCRGDERGEAERLPRAGCPCMPSEAPPGGRQGVTLATVPRVELPVEQLEVAAYTIPTDAPEADGTLSWDATTIVVVHARAAGERGIGYTYADVSTAKL